MNQQIKFPSYIIAHIFVLVDLNRFEPCFRAFVYSYLHNQTSFSPFISSFLKKNLFIQALIILQFLIQNSWPLQQIDMLQYFQMYQKFVGRKLPHIQQTYQTRINSIPFDVLVYNQEPKQEQTRTNKTYVVQKYVQSKKTVMLNVSLTFSSFVAQSRNARDFHVLNLGGVFLSF